MFVFAAAATTFANSVLPEPGGPSARIGFCILAARNTTFRVTGSATYLAAASFSDNCSIDANTGCAPAALILKHKEMESRFSQRGNIWRHKIVGERISRLKNGQTIRGHSGHSGCVLHDEAHSYTMIAPITRVRASNARNHNVTQFA